MPKSKRLRQVGKSQKRSPGQWPGRRTGTEPAARNHLVSNSGRPGTETAPRTEMLRLRGRIAVTARLAHQTQLRTNSIRASLVAQR